MVSEWEHWKQRLDSARAEGAPLEPEPSAMDRKRAHEAAQEAGVGAHLERCGVPLRAIETIVAGPRETPAVVGVREWLKGNKTFCLLVGGVGCGKTVAACAALKLARKSAWFMGDDGQPLQSWSYSAREGLFVRAAELSSTSPWAEEGRGKWSRVRSVPWLVIDDLGVERLDSAGIWAEQLDLLADKRDGARLRTVITTNLHRDSFLQRYLGRAADRLINDGHVVLCGSESLRGERQ